jgi:hypothetical protein
MKKWITPILLASIGFSFTLNGAVVNMPSDTLKCDTFIFKSGARLPVRIIGSAIDTFVIAYCGETRTERISPKELKEIRYSYGRVQHKREIRRAASIKREVSRRLDPERFQTFGKLQLTFAIPLGLAGILFALFSLSYGGSLIMGIVVILLPLYFIYKAISSFRFARWLRKRKAKRPISG